MRTRVCLHHPNSPELSQFSNCQLKIHRQLSCKEFIKGGSEGVWWRVRGGECCDWLVFMDEACQACVGPVAARQRHIRTPIPEGFEGRGRGIWSDLCHDLAVCYSWVGEESDWGWGVGAPDVSMAGVI